jgi:hypothetical protein
VAAGDSAATATLQMWQRSNNSSSGCGSASWEGGSDAVGSGVGYGSDVPQLLDVICIVDCEWLGR